MHRNILTVVPSPEFITRPVLSPDVVGECGCHTVTKNHHDARASRGRDQTSFVSEDRSDTL